MTEPYFWGLVDGVRTSQPEALTNARLNQTTDALLERIDAVAEGQEPAPGSVTDEMLGPRTADENTSHNSPTGKLTQVLSYLAKGRKTVADGLSALAASLGTAATRNVGTGAGDVAAGNHSHAALDSATFNATGNTLMQRNASGQVHVSPPTAGGHATNKEYVDTQFNDLAARCGSPVQSLAALRAVNTTNLGDKQIRLVEDEGALFRFDSEGTGADDNSLTIVPTTGPGRWFKAQVATSDHNALFGLQGGSTNDRQHLTTAQVNALPTAAQKSALAGTAGTPGAGNEFVTAQGLTKSAVGLGNVSNDAQLKASSNLSDVSNTLLARSNLGLGNSATLSVGTTPGTVAAGQHAHGTGDITGLQSALDTKAAASQPAARVYRTTNQSIPHDTSTAILFSTARISQGGVWNPSSPTRLTAPSAGVYLITGHIVWAQAADTGRRSLALRHNNTTFIASVEQQETASNADATSQSVSTMWQMAAGDYIEMSVYQTSGGAQNVLTVNAYTPELCMVRLSG